MKVAVVHASQLKGCWSAVRFTSGCFCCPHYKTCKKPERQANKAYDRVVAQARQTIRAAEAKVKKLKEQAERLQLGARRVQATSIVTNHTEEPR